MIITIEGKNGEGKTTLAKMITEINNKKAIFIYEYDLYNKSWLSELDSSIHFLVIDEITEIKKAKLFLKKIKVKLPTGIILIRQNWLIKIKK